MHCAHLLPRLALPCSLVLALACGDDGDDGGDDSAAGTTTTAGTTTSDPSAEGSTAEASTTLASGDASTGAPVECEAMCDEGQICVATGSCAEEHACAPAQDVICDFGTGLCSVEGVCSGQLQTGTLVCETCG